MGEKIPVGQAHNTVRMGMRDIKECDEVKLTNLLLYLSGAVGTGLRHTSCQLVTHLRYVSNSSVVTTCNYIAFPMFNIFLLGNSFSLP